MSERRRLLGWVLSGHVVAVWLGTPCTSFSRARDRPGGPPRLRSNEHVLGLPNLRECDHVKVLQGNLFMRFSCAMLRACQRMIVPAAMENPASSRIWLCKPVADLCRSRNARYQTTDYCQFNAPWRKRTGFLSTFLDLSAACRRCTGRGLCSATGRAHVTLAGQDENGVLRTAIDEPYPRELCKKLVQCYSSALTAFEIKAWDVSLHRGIQDTRRMVDVP